MPDKSMVWPRLLCDLAVIMLAGLTQPAQAQADTARSATASATFNAPSNTGSPVVFSKSASTSGSRSLSTRNVSDGKLGP